MKEALYILGGIVHNLQKERGCASMFLCSKGELFEQRINDQFVDTDNILNSFTKKISAWKDTNQLQPAQLKKLKTLTSKCEELPELRNNIIAQKISASKVIDHYAHQLIGPILQIMIEIALYMKGHNPVFVSAYNAFLQWKERIGLERAIGAKGFVNHSFHNSEFLERILFLLSEQRNHRRTFMALANDAQLELIKQVLKGKPSTQLKQLHSLFRADPKSAKLYDLTPENWFDLISAKIDALRTIETKLVDTLSDEGADIATPKQIVNNSFGEYENLISSLQLFSGLSSENLNSILRYAQIREFYKGKLLFLEGEQANRLYIILKGWVKIFKGTAAGDEAILEMLSSGDSIMESAVFLNSSFPVSAQVAEDTVLLSIPAPMLREQIKNNNEFALNLLATMSQHSQGLIRQIEDARLKSVDERIGWFLLRLLIEQGNTSRNIELPYDKSLIASYLDMQRETFSRSLKRLKAKNYKIENNTIIIPHSLALFKFCDSDITHICSLFDTPNCPNSHE